MKTFLKTIRSSVYDPEFYKTIDSQRTSTSFKYFVKLNLLLALLVTIAMSFIIIPSSFVVLKQANVDKLVQYFPKDLEITIKDGHASSNKTGPYAIPVGEKEINLKNNEKITFKNLITIDTTSDFSIDKFKASDSLAYLSKDYLVYQEGRDQIKLQSLKSIHSLTLSQAEINSWVTKILPYAKIIIPFAILGLFVVFFLGSLVGNLIFILISSLIVLIVEKIRKINTSFGAIYKRALHLVTAVIILNFILFLFGFGSIWPVNLALFLWLYYSNFKVVTK